MKNIPYVKKYEIINGIKTLINPITKNRPFNNNNSSNRYQKRNGGKYIVRTNPITGEAIGKVKINGNNRKPCKRTSKKRNSK